MESTQSDLRVLMEELARASREYFAIASKETKPREPSFISEYELQPNYYWSQLSEVTKNISRELVDRTIRYSNQLATLAKSAPLTGSEDISDLREATKSMRAALRLRHYRFQDLEVIHDEDRVLGIRPPTQSHDACLSPTQAQSEFDQCLFVQREILKLVESSDTLFIPPTTIESQPTKYRPNTAFVMMQIDQDDPTLEDVLDAVKHVFRDFGISAVRADEIEHDGQITDRVLNELRTSEFLFADLTGARPNVYYEVGFAHALNRRVILYRRSGTGLHFDLAGYNCPEYAGIKDLKAQLSKRLEAVIGKPSSGPNTAPSI